MPLKQHKKSNLALSTSLIRWGDCPATIYLNKHLRLQITTITLQKKEICAQQNVPAKCFTICYIFCIRKPTNFSPFSFFFFFFWIWGSISCMKYSKFWNILLTISLSLNLLFLKSVLLGIFTMSLHKKKRFGLFCVMYKKGKENIRREFSSSLIMIINCMFDFQQSI